MEALILLVPLSLVAVAVAVAIFFRMSDSGQFDDDVGPAWSVLMDDDRPPPAAPGTFGSGGPDGSRGQEGSGRADGPDGTGCARVDPPLP